MTRLRFVIDMNLSPEWVTAFAEIGIDAIHWSTVGEVAASDTSIMALAAHDGRVVFTNDLDFGTLLALTRAAAPSVMQLRTSYFLPDKLMPTVQLALLNFSEELLRGALVVIDVAKHRVRMLPLKKADL